jgi:hypothetical protein
MFSAKNQFFLIELIHLRLHPVNFRVQLRKMNKVVILGENIVRSGNSQDQRVLAGLVKTLEISENSLGILYSFKPNPQKLIPIRNRRQNTDNFDRL